MTFCESVKLASIRLLGHDMAKIAHPETRAVVKKIIDAETGRHTHNRLIIHMIGGTTSFENRFDEALLFLEKLKKGLAAD